ncbi:hypothetical protein DE146DRAFT_106290 [Phaeosphaeria sp. MPI-PUGE-AT-0046c]|nr:hypothetical protein DE146DRAFT_106290 [Phaeosphaeria sp. MPI-PUGE-AT-0046c]
MSPEHDASIASTTPTNGTHSKAHSTTTGKQHDMSQAKTIEAPLEPKAKGKAKRPLSTSASPPPPKRATMSTSTTLPSKKSYAYTDLSPSWLPNPPAPKSKDPDPAPKTLQLTYHTGDIFSAAPSTLLIHACNTQGHWGAGIAKAFKTLYPKAFKAHHDFCAKEHGKDEPVPTGTAQLIGPVDAADGEGHWVGCVFTSAKYGKKKDKGDVIVRHTGESMRMLLELVRMVDEGSEEGARVGTIRMCRINSGKFGVPWEKTEAVLKGIVLQEGWRGTVEVWSPEEA